MMILLTKRCRPLPLLTLLASDGIRPRAAKQKPMPAPFLQSLQPFTSHQDHVYVFINLLMNIFSKFFMLTRGGTALNIMYKEESWKLLHRQPALLPQSHPARFGRIAGRSEAEPQLQPVRRQRDDQLPPVRNPNRSKARKCKYIGIDEVVIGKESSHDQGVQLIIPREMNSCILGLQLSSLALKATEHFAAANR